MRGRPADANPEQVPPQVSGTATERRPAGRWLLPVVLFLAVVAVATALRLHHLSAQPLWTDELFSLQSTAGRGFWVEQLPRGVVMSPAVRPTELAAAAPPADIYWSQATDTHPPVYYVLLRFVREAFGSGLAALRGPSSVASVGTVVIGFISAAAMARMAGRSERPFRWFVAALAAGLCATSTPQIWYAQEARGYAIGVALVCITAATALLAKVHGWSVSRLIVAGAAAFLAVGTLYLTVIPLAAIALYLLLELPRQRRATLLLLALTALSCALAWGPLLLAQRHNVGLRNQWLVSATSRSPGIVASDVAVALFEQFAPLQSGSHWAAYAVAGLLILSAVPLYRHVPASRLWLLWLGSCAAALAAADLLGNTNYLLYPRYTLLLGPPLMALAVCPMLWPARPGRTAPRFGLVVPLGLLLLCVTSLSDAYRPTKENWWLVRDYVRAGHARPDDLFVVAATGGRRWDHILYLGLCRYVETPSLTAAIVDSPETDCAAVRAEATRRARVVVIAEPGTDATPCLPPGFIRTALSGIPSVGTLATYQAPSPAP